MSEKKSVKWEAGAYIWITVASPERDPYKVNKQHHQDCTLFYQWMIDNKIKFITNRVGGGKFDGLIKLDEWSRVEKWLNENGYEQGSTAIPDPIEEAYWSEYEKMGG